IVAGANFTMVVADFLQERPRHPSVHARRRDRDPIDTTALDCDIAPSLFKAFPSEYLTSSGYVSKVGEAVGVCVPIGGGEILNERSSRHAEPGVLAELRYQERIILGVE